MNPQLLIATLLVISVEFASAQTGQLIQQEEGRIISPQPETTFAPVVKGMVLADVEHSELHSRFTGQDYFLYVYLPASYSQGNQRYPVLYVPDIDSAFLAAREACRLMSFRNMLEELILVGVPLKCDGVEDWIRKRTFDLTPTEDKEFDLSFSKRFHGEVHSGGAHLFLRTLKEELIPFIESRYRTTSDRGLAGYSLGGLFAFYVLLNGGDTFSRYLIGSPSLWWDHGMILKAEAALAGSGKTLRGRVFLSVGAEEEDTEMIGPFKRLTVALTDHAYPSLRLQSEIFERVGHEDGALGAISRGLKVVYARSRP